MAQILIVEGGLCVARNDVPGYQAVWGMGRSPMRAKRKRSEGYPKNQANPPVHRSIGAELGAGVPVDTVAVDPQARSGPSRVLENGYLKLYASRFGRGLQSRFTSNSCEPGTARTPFFIARNEGSSMVPDNYACIHRIKYNNARKPPSKARDHTIKVDPFFLLKLIPSTHFYLFEEPSFYQLQRRNCAKTTFLLKVASTVLLDQLTIWPTILADGRNFDLLQVCSSNHLLNL